MENSLRNLAPVLNQPGETGDQEPILVSDSLQTKFKRQTVSDWIPAVRSIGNSLIGAGGGEPAKRLFAAAQQARAVSETLNGMSIVSDELETAASAIEAGQFSPGIQTLGGLIRPDSAALSYAHLGNNTEFFLQALSRLSSDLTTGLQRIESTAFMATVNSDDAYAAGLALTGRESVATALVMATGQACRLLDSALIEVGQTLFGVAQVMESLLAFADSPIDYCPGDGKADDIRTGEIRNCVVQSYFYVPAGMSKKAKELLTGFLKYLGTLAQEDTATEKALGEALSFGGTTLLRGVITGVEKIIKIREEQAKKFLGYNVFVILRYEQCVEKGDARTFDTVFKEVKLSPPSNNRYRSEFGADIWKKKPINRLRKFVNSKAKKPSEKVKELLGIIDGLGKKACTKRMSKGL